MPFDDNIVVELYCKFRDFVRQTPLEVDRTSSVGYIGQGEDDTYDRRESRDGFRCKHYAGVEPCRASLTHTSFDCIMYSYHDILLYPRSYKKVVAMTPRECSSHLSYSHFYVGSLFVDIHLHVARSYTSTPDSPFNQSIILFADATVSQWAHAIQRSIPSL